MCEHHVLWLEVRRGGTAGEGDGEGVTVGRVDAVFAAVVDCGWGGRRRGRWEVGEELRGPFLEGGLGGAGGDEGEVGAGVDGAGVGGDGGGVEVFVG